MMQNTTKTEERPRDQERMAGNIFRYPYRNLSREDILRHYGRRGEITCFSVADREETRREKIDGILQNRFEFNNETYTLKDPIDWLNNPSEDIEWHILMHKFYYAVGLGMAYNQTGYQGYREKWVELTTSWIDTGVPSGYIAGDVTGRRIQNWVYAYFHFVLIENSNSISPEFNHKFLTSLHRQTQYLVDHLAPARNHRTLELYGVFLVAVVFPEFADSTKWLEFSLDEIVKNMQSDLQEDGVHCEQSTDYHHIVLKNYLCIRRLAAMNQIAVPIVMDVLLVKALEFAMHAHRPDGIIPSFSDGDSGSFLDLLKQGHDLYGRNDMLYVATQGKEGTPPRARCKVFPNSGYCFLRSGWGESSDRFKDERYLIFDCGPLGEGNHGHLDLLSFEISAYGHPLVVDPGRYTYDEKGEINWRVLFRGTGYHNTVQVDKKNQTRYVKGQAKFKIKGPEPDFDLSEFVTQPGYDLLCGIASSHEYDAIHERKIFFIRGQYWVIFDHLIAEETHDYDQLFHLSANAFQKTTVQEIDGTQIIDSPNMTMARSVDQQISLHVEDGFVSRKYGEKQSAPVARFSQRAKNATFHTVLYPYKQNVPEITVKRIPVFDKMGREAGSVAQAISVTIRHEGQTFNDMYFSGPLDVPLKWEFGGQRFDGSHLFTSRDSLGSQIDMHQSRGSRIEKIETLDETLGVIP